MSVRNLIMANGICRIHDAYTREQIDVLNGAVDPVLAGRVEKKRSYVQVDELNALGILDVIFGRAMLDVLFSIMPDPVLYHCAIIETAGNDAQPNLFAERMSGWHRDIDSSFSDREPTHVSVFVYLSDVGDCDGAFEFVPQSPRRWLTSATPTVLVKGETGYAFAWHRSYFHRASPNRGPSRRRVLKISVQRNSFQSRHLTNVNFHRVISELTPGHRELDVLFGRYQGKRAPTLHPCAAPLATEIAPNGVVGVANVELVQGQVRRQAGAIYSRICQSLFRREVAYD